MNVMQMVVTIVVAMFASAGFWAFLQNMVCKTRALDKLQLALVQDRFVCLAQGCINNGNVTKQEYKILLDIFTPYNKAGGDGLVDKYWAEVNKLPLVDER